MARWWIRKGWDVEAVSRHVQETGGVRGYNDGRFVEDGAKVLEAECDILIPAAIDSVINQQNADRIKAPLIIEAANGPITAEADRILVDKGTVIIPDLYANAGGVTVSYFEWVENLSHIRFGRMQRRQEEARNQLLLDELNRLFTNSKISGPVFGAIQGTILEGSGRIGTRSIRIGGHHAASDTSRCASCGARATMCRIFAPQDSWFP